MSIRFPFFNRKPFIQKPTPPIQGQSKTIQEEAWRETLRQARHSYNLYALGVVATTILSITASALVLTNRLTEAGLTAATGFGFITYSAQMNKESQEKLQELQERLQKPPKG
ncbi:hypothetical protein HJG54_15695 [Leptolyngbya sp. NK1-12]|uniref:Cyanobacterial TRADD-N associated 2 transmembrane domain-containing protein n=1 Tax=Leptolyngbya sp. NK1-12 TaxID=2547451 RepID=A0AA96WDA5_9CYAN|nr:hypothetical protein [Leptolyngbya sp. NK1-12]WNZ24157.1 hypothetical protein HJG54_15695 [Leptolyngbya sp. NK1-12]